jgi:hypothetical protein
MAKKNRKRPSGRPQGRGPGTNPAGKAAEIPRVAPAEPGGPNRLARKEEARRQREAIQRKMSRRRYYRVLAALVAVLVVGGAIAAYALTRPDPKNAAGAGPVISTKEYTAGGLTDRAHVPQSARPKLSTYPTHPPASGPHDPTPLAAGVYDTPPDVYRSIHSLEHGTVIIWYRPGVSSSDLQKIKDFYSSSLNNDHVIVAPYSYPTEGAVGSLPQGKDMVLVAWHRYQACTHINLAAAQFFVKSYRTPTAVPKPVGYKGVAPEAGRAIS